MVHVALVDHNRTRPRWHRRPPHLRPRWMSLALALALAAVAGGCSGGSAAPAGSATAPPTVRRVGADEVAYRGTPAPRSRAADQRLLVIPSGRYVAGSDADERAQAYRDYRRTAGHDGAKRGRWFDREEARHQASLPRFRIDAQLVDNSAYAEFVRDTGAALPNIDQAAWQAQGFIQDYASEVVRFGWREPAPPPGRADHPVVLVTWEEAAQYCAWRGQLVGEARRLPTAAEYEKAARGPAGHAYPWGDEFAPALLNSQVAGPRDTTPVDAFPAGRSGYGMYDAAGNVFEWTATRWRDSDVRMTVKGSAWDDYAGVGRGAQRHGRRAWVRHVLIGFRCAADAGETRESSVPAGRG